MTDHRQNTTFLGAAISRRTVMGSTSALLGGLVVAGCTPAEPRVPHSRQGVLASAREPLPPLAPEPDGYAFFTDEEARTVEAVVARLIPGDDDDPGAVQAGVPVYIDRKLSRFGDYPDATFRQGPYAVGYAEGEQPPSGPDVVAIPEDDLRRYGFQLALTPQQVYRQGLPALDRYAQERFGAAFADLGETEQDALLVVLDDTQQRTEAGGEEAVGGGGADQEADEDEGATGSGGASGDEEMDLAEEIFGEVAPGTLFATIYDDTIEGMFADPMYGGNRGLAGWRLVGYPGAQRSYSPHEMLHGTDKEPQGMHGLPAMRPDRPGGGVPALEQSHHDHGGG